MEETTSHSATSARNAVLVLMVTASLLLAARGAIALKFDLFPDESLYAWLAQHAPFRFAPHPPGVPFLVRVGTALLGKTEIGVRIFSALLTTLALVPLYGLARDVGGGRVAFWSVIAAAAMPSYFAFGAVATPDGTQLFFWAAALYFTYNALTTSRLDWWILVGVTIGVGLYVKYILILYYPSLALCLVLSPAWRAHLRSRGLYVSVAVAFLLFAPAAIGHEYATHWNAVRYHLSDRQTLQSPSFKDITRYQLVHAGYLSPLLYVGLLTAMVWSGVRGVQKKDSRLIFLFSFSAVTYVFFLAIAMVTKRVLNREQWDAPAYLSALIAAVMMTQTWLPTLSERRRQLLRAYVASSLAVGILTTTVYVLEGTTGLGSRLTGTRPRFTKLLGWRAMSEQADRQLASLPNADAAFFLGETFPCALAYAFYGRQTRRVYTLDRAYSAKYGVVESLRRLDAAQVLDREFGHNALYVAEMSADLPDEIPHDLLARKQQLRRAFDAVEEIPPVAVTRNGKVVKWFYVLRCVHLRRAL
jgi:4-amino-4-deoxy-L-arabinose transferase-like glycosyltransferase